MSRKGMPNKKRILSFWSNHDLFTEAGIEINESNADCFACGNHVGVERAHILPLAEGGNNEPENLHLLCKGCHSESESLSGTPYWKWLKDKNWNHFETAIERMYKKFQVNPEHWIRALKILRDDPKLLSKYNLNVSEVQDMISKQERSLSCA